MENRQEVEIRMDVVAPVEFVEEMDGGTQGWNCKSVHHEERFYDGRVGCEVSDWD